MSRAELLRLLLVQNLVLLILSFGWLYFFPNPAVYGAIRAEPVLLWALPLAIGLLGAGALAVKLIPALRAAQLYVAKQLFEALGPQDIVSVGLLAGVAEELFFRGLVQNAWGLIPASLLFGVMHLPGREHWVYALWATIMGASLGLIYQLSDNLLLAMLVHVLNNSLALLLWPKLKHLYDSEPAAGKAE